MNKDGMTNIKVGDRVLVRESRNDSVTQEVATAITKGGRITVGRWKFKSDGRQINGDKWFPYYLEPFDELKWNRQVEANRHRRRVSDLTNFNWFKADASLVARIHDLLPKKEVSDEQRP